MATVSTTWNKGTAHDLAMSLPEDMKVANCVACLATADCKGCAFRIGRAVRVVHYETLRLKDPVECEKFWATLPAWLWDAYWKYLYGALPKPKFTLLEERQAEAMAGCN